MLVRCADGTRCSSFASALFCLWRPQIHEPVHVQAFIPDAAIKRFNMRIVRRSERTGAIECDLVEVRSGVQRPGDELSTVVNLDSLRQLASCFDFSQLVADLLALDRFIHVYG